MGVASYAVDEKTGARVRMLVAFRNTAGRDVAPKTYSVTRSRDVSNYVLRLDYALKIRARMYLPPTGSIVGALLWRI